MKFLLSCIALISSMAFAQNFPGTDRCTIGEVERTFARSRSMCDEKLADFEAQYQGIKCDVSRYHLSVCWANCYNSGGGLFAKTRVDMTAFCESEHVSYRRTKITFY